MGPTADELAVEEVAEERRIILHSILIVGYGVRNGVEYYKIKNTYGIEWGHQGFGKIRRDLVYRLAYPIGPAEIKAEPAASVTVIKNTRPPRIKRHEGRPKTSRSRMQFGAQGKRSGTEATKTRKHPIQDDIDDINEAKRRCKTNAVWGVELKPDKPFTHIFEKEQGRLHVSQATLGTGSTSMKSIVQCQVGDKKPICMCSLLPGKQETCPLNLGFEEDQDVTFLVTGSHNVHLSGFFYGEHEDCFADEYGFDPHEEGVVHTDCVPDASVEFEYDMEDEEKDAISDDDFSMYPPSPVPNSGDSGSSGVKKNESQLKG